MYSKKIVPWIFCFYLLLLYSCNNHTNKNASDPEDPQFVQGSSAWFFEEARNENDAREITLLLNQALKSSENGKDTLLPYILDHKIYYHNRLKEYDSSLYFTDSLIATAGAQQDTAMLALGHYRKSKIYFYRGEQEEVFRHAFESRNLYLSAGDSSMAGSRTLEMANAQQKLGDYTGSQASATEALRYLNVNTDSVYISSAYNVIGSSLSSQLFYADAIPEYRNALQFSTSRKDSLTYSNNLALVLQENGEFEEAKDIFSDLLVKVEPENTRSRARYMDNLAYTRWLQDPEATVEQDLLEAMNLRLEVNDNNGLQASYAHLTSYYEEKDGARAGNYARDLLAAAHAVGNPNTQLEALKYLIALSPGAAAKELSGRYITLDDSLNNAALRAKNSFAKIKFDEERKQQEIVNLESRNAVQRLEAQRLQARGWTVVMTAAVLILAMFFLLYYFRQRHKKEKIWEVQKTESRISRLIHDELANDIFNVMSSLEAVVPEPVIDRLEKIYLRTRDISRENSDIDTGKDFPDYLRANLSNNSPANSKLVITGENSVNWDKLGEEKKIVIYRILQELMVNMNKHSNATLVAITFSVFHKKLHIQYFDNGCGTTWNPSRKGSGLQNVENRIHSLNGKINFESEAGKGFKVMMQIAV